MGDIGIDEVIEKGRNLLSRVSAGDTLGADLGLSVRAQETLYQLAYAAYGRAKYDDAKRFFALLMTADHLDRRYFMGFAACMHMQGRHEEAVKYYMLASMLDMTDPEPPMHCAECHLALGDTVRARTSLEYALGQAQAHQAHGSHVPRLEAMLAFLDGKAAESTQSEESSHGN